MHWVYIIIIVALFYFAPWQNNATGYVAYCEDGFKNEHTTDLCNSGLSKYFAITYHANANNQTVISGDPPLLTKLKNCIVANSENWVCDSDEADYIYSENGKVNILGSMNRYRYVSKWKYWTSFEQQM